MLGTWVHVSERQSRATAKGHGWPERHALFLGEWGAPSPGSEGPGRGEVRRRQRTRPHPL